MQSEDFAFAQYVRETIKELIKPLEEILPTVIPGLSPSELPSDIGKLFFNDFWLLFLDVAGAEHHIKASEASILQNILRTLGIAFDDELIDGSKRLSHLYRSSRKHLSNRSAFSEGLGLLTIDVLQVYDTKNGTSYAEKAKEMFYRLVAEIIVADRQVMKEEETKLSAIRAALWSSDTTASSDKGEIRS